MGFSVAEQIESSISELFSQDSIITEGLFEDKCSQHRMALS